MLWMCVLWGGVCVCVEMLMTVLEVVLVLVVEVVVVGVVV